MRIRIMASIPCALLLVGLVSATPSWDRFEDIPGAKAVQEAQSTNRRLVVTPRASDVRWDLENKRAFARVGSEWIVVDLATCTTVDGSDLERPAAAKGERSRRGRRGGGQRPARGRQATSTISEEGTWTALHRDNNVILKGKDGTERAVTTEGTDRKRFGTASWVYGEELDQQSAMWFSPDEKKLAFYAFDVTDVPDYFLLGGLTKLRTTIMDEAYPKPGDPNPIAGLRIHDIASGETITVDVGKNPDQYVYGIEFSPDSRHLLFRRMNRHQNKLELVVVDPGTGDARTLVEETQPTWVAHDFEMRWLEDGKRFLLASERTGFKTYELWNVDSGQLAVLGSGEFPAASIVRIDEDTELPGGGRLYFSGSGGEHPLDVQLYSVDFDGSGLRRITTEALSHSGFQIAPDGSATLATAQAWDTPPRLLLYCAGAAKPVVLKEASTERLEESGARPSELFSFQTADGTQTCYGRIHYPRSFDPSKKWPILVNVYGGPESRSIRNSFAVSDPMTEFGFVIVQVDNRGTEGRGKAFEGATYLKLGQVDLDDQAQAIRTLVERHDFLDGDRVGITGHSYGGYMSVMALLRHPEVFNVAVSGAPVTDWRNYDTIYTERYMRTPSENPEGYAEGSCVGLAGNLEGELLLMQGMVDDNVHPTNAWQLVNEWQTKDIPFEMQFFPTSAHGIWAPASRSAKWSFLVEHLVESESP